MGTGGLELFSPSSSPGNPPTHKKEETRKLQVTLEDFLPKGEKARLTGSRPGPACSKGAKPDNCRPDETRLEPRSTPGPSQGNRERPSLPPSPTPAGAPIHMDVDSDVESVGRGTKRAHKKTVPAYYISSSTESDEGPTKRGRGRPAKDPSHKGQFTAQALAQKAEAEKAKQLKKDHRAITNPEVKPTSGRATRAQNEALERAEELEAQPLAAVAAVMSNSLGMIAKSVERSGNIQGPIKRDLWTAYTELTAGLTAIVARQGESNEARLQREESAALKKARAKWAKEKAKLKAELGQLRVRVERLQCPSMAQGGEYTDAEVQTDLDEEVLGALVGSPSHVPDPNEDLDTGAEELPAPEPPELVGGATMRPKKGPMVVSVEKLKEPLVISARDFKKPYYRPPLQGVSKQLNPLSKAADRVAAPASRTSFPSLPPPTSSLETSGWTRVEDGRRKEKKRAKALTEDSLKEAHSRVLPAVLAEMGLLPAPRVPERPRAPPTAGKTARQSGAAPQKGAGNAVATTAKPAPTQKTTTPSILELWTEVVSKKSRRKAARAVEEAAKTAPTVKRPTRVLPVPPQKTPSQQSSSKKKKKKRGGRGEGQGGPGGPPPPSGVSSQGPARVTRIKPPTTAAVTVTCADPGAYAAVTGALILEVRGVDNGTKADALAEGIRAALTGRDDVKVARPCKTVELRLTGLDDSVTSSEVAEVLGAMGGCSPHDLKVGDIRMAPNGLGTCWVRCPAKAGKAVLAAPRVRVGWSSCRVALLPSRGLQCHRCGGIGHLANACKEKAGCPVCKDAGKPAEHRIGAKGCLANKPQKAPPSAGGRSEAGSTATPTLPQIAAPPEIEAPLPQRERRVREEEAATDCVEMQEVEETREQANDAP
ncbi:serine/arginine repetitive matrix protein 1-like [Solenopsis invicta]|uniref:serine/arginine repetitive matrix protein 1-like n=1 Tax=Solenopsis invicta TaxID=13686 RepID=UPI00193CF922|nr:serine/arginine repetitive matrix protein 1-like [Solenopsis invicta]